MTLTKCIELALANAGLASTAATFQTKARDYINLGTKEISAVKEWRWLFAEGSITTTAHTSEYDLADDGMHPVSFRNVTDDFEMRMVDVLALDRIDPDTDLKSGPENVAVIKWNGTNTNWTVQLWPTPDTNSETIKYRYRKYIADFTSSNDATELDTLGLPDWVQPAVMYYAAAKIMQEKQDAEGSALAQQSYDRMVRHYLEVDMDASGSQGCLTHLIRTDAVGFGDFTFKTIDGSLAVAS